MMSIEGAVETRYNPFNYVGAAPASGADFVGRERDVERLRRAVGDPRRGRCIAINGLGRVGKSSLVEHTLLTDRAWFWERQILPVRLAIATCQNGPAFYRRLVNAFEDELQEAAPSLLNGIVGKKIEQFRQAHEAYELAEVFESLLIAICNCKWRSVLVLDEFDAAPRVFADPADFQIIRDLPQKQRQNGTSLILVSRRPVAEIERRICGVSNLDGILDPWTLRPFDEEDEAAMLEKLRPIGIEITQELFQTAHQLCGGHPYLLGCFCREIADELLDGYSPNLDDVTSWRGLAPQFSRYYKDVAGFLNDIQMYEKLMEVLFGPQISAHQTDADFLLSYGLIKIEKSPKQYYISFSEHFDIYLAEQSRTNDAWNHWIQTERAVRGWIDEQFTEHYGTSDWLVPFAEKVPQINELKLRLTDVHEKEKRLYGLRASHFRLDYAYWCDLWCLIKHGWPYISAILIKKHDKKEWARRFEVLGRVRNAMAHGREPASAEERIEAQAYCTEILNLLHPSGHT